MVSYFLRWTLLKFFSSIPDEQSQQKVRRLGRITCALISTSNEVKCPLRWKFWINNFSRSILERVVGNIVNIRNEFLFFWVYGVWIVARNKQITREPLRGSRDLFVPRYVSYPMNPKKRRSFLKYPKQIWKAKGSASIMSLFNLKSNIQAFLALWKTVVSESRNISTFNCFASSPNLCLCAARSMANGGILESTWLTMYRVDENSPFMKSKIADHNLQVETSNERMSLWASRCIWYIPLFPKLPQCININLILFSKRQFSVTNDCKGVFNAFFICSVVSARECELSPTSP